MLGARRELNWILYDQDSGGLYLYYKQCMHATPLKATTIIHYHPATQNYHGHTIFNNTPEIFFLKHIFKSNLKKYEGVKISPILTIPLKMNLRILLIRLH
jgi:hypothetical protein